jgi:hypothetical protein
MIKVVCGRGPTEGELEMKYLFATMAVLATIGAASALPMGKQQNYTPLPDVHKASCQTVCYTDSAGRTVCQQNCGCVGWMCK